MLNVSSEVTLIVYENINKSNCAVLRTAPLEAHKEPALRTECVWSIENAFSQYWEGAMKFMTTMS